MGNFKRQLRAALLLAAVTFAQGELAYRKRQQRDNSRSTNHNHNTYDSARGSTKSQSGNNNKQTQNSVRGSTISRSGYATHQKFESSQKATTKNSAYKTNKLSADTSATSSHKSSYNTAGLDGTKTSHVSTKTSYVSEWKSHDDNHHDDSSDYYQWHQNYESTGSYTASHTRSSTRSKPQMMMMVRSKSRGSFKHSKKSKSRGMMSMLQSADKQQDFFASQDEESLFVSKDDTYLSYPPAATPVPTSTTGPTLSPVQPSTTTDAPVTSMYTTAPKPTTKSPTRVPTRSPTTPNPTPKEDPEPSPSLGGSGEYNIDLSFASNMPTILQGEIRMAADRIEEVIVGDLPDRTRFTIPPDYQCADQPTYIDDMWICAQYGPLPEFVEGEGGFQRVRQDGTFLPFVGYITFSDSLPDPPYEVILHEMLHAIGFGTIWQKRDLIDSEDPPCMYSKTSNATTEFLSLSGCSGTVGAPIDQFACSHWDETCLVNELMTPTLPGDLEVDAPLSRITVGSLEDLGYGVNYDAADPFTGEDMDPSCTCPSVAGRKHKGSARVASGLRHHRGRYHHEEERVPTVPPMSKELKEKATEYGKKVLKERRDFKQEQHQKRRRQLLAHPYLVDKKTKKDEEEVLKEEEEGGIFLLVRENGWRYSIVVTE